jgi:hypothetical protein
MNSPSLTDSERDAVGSCLRVAADGPYFPNWEFETLIGASRDEVRAASDEWLKGMPRTARANEVAISVLVNLLGYPHRLLEQLPGAVGHGIGEIQAALRKLSS